MHVSVHGRGIDTPRATPCRYLEAFPGSLPELQTHIHVVLDERDSDEGDSCLFALIDSIAYKYIADTSMVAITLIDSLCEASDGYVAEYVSEAVASILLARPAQVFRYLYHHRDYHSESGLKADMIYVMRGMIRYSDTMRSKKRIDDVVSMASRSLTSEELGYLHSIQEEWERAD